jgi:hypothetical protein
MRPSLVLEHIARGATLQQPKDGFAVVVHCQDEDGRLRARLAKPTGHLDTIDVGQIDVQHQHVGLVLFHQPQCIITAAPLGHHGDLLNVIQGSPHPGPHNWMIVHDDDRQRACSLT